MLYIIRKLVTGLKFEGYLFNTFFKRCVFTKAKKSKGLYYREPQILYGKWGTLSVGNGMKYQGTLSRHDEGCCEGQIYSFHLENGMGLKGA